MTDQNNAGSSRTATDRTRDTNATLDATPSMDTTLKAIQTAMRTEVAVATAHLPPPPFSSSNQAVIPSSSNPGMLHMLMCNQLTSGSPPLTSLSGPPATHAGAPSPWTDINPSLMAATVFGPSDIARARHVPSVSLPSILGRSVHWPGWSQPRYPPGHRSYGHIPQVVLSSGSPLTPHPTIGVESLTGVNADLPHVNMSIFVLHVINQDTEHSVAQTEKGKNKAPLTGDPKPAFREPPLV